MHFYGDRGGRRVPPRQLPAGVRGFVNRVDDLDRLDRILGESTGSEGSPALCILVGTAGVGKTSLAVHWAHRVVGRFPDGQLYVNLHGYDPGPPVTPHQALERFLTALQVPPESIPADPEGGADAYRSLLADRRILVVLDNASSVAQVRPLLPGTAGCLVLITSRSRLSGLVARDGAHRVSLGVLSEEQSIELLRGVTAGYRTPDDPAELGELAGLCARLPLALRIAAERAASRPHMPLRALIGELRDESMLWDALTADDDDADAVRAVFAWSYRALTKDAGRLFRLLGRHPTTGEVALRSTRLLGDRAGEAESLESLGKAKVQSGAVREGIGFHRTALSIRRDLGDLPGTLSSVNALGLAFLRRRDLGDALHCFEEARDIAGRLDSDYWSAVSTTNIAQVHLDAGRWAEAERRLRWALEVYRAIGDRICEGDCLHGLSGALRGQGRLAEALEAIDHALALARADEYPVAEAFWLVESAQVQCASGHPDHALAALQRAASMQRRFGDRVRESIALDATGEAYGLLGRHEDAVRFHRMAVSALRGSENPWLLATALTNLAAALRGSGVVAGVRESAAEALTLLAPFDDPAAVAARERAAALVADEG